MKSNEILRMRNYCKEFEVRLKKVRNFRNHRKNNSTAAFRDK